MSRSIRIAARMVAGKPPLRESMTAPTFVYDHGTGDSLWLERHPAGYAIYHVCNKRGTCIGKFPGKSAPQGVHKARFATDDELRRCHVVMRAARAKGLVTESVLLPVVQ